MLNSKCFDMPGWLLQVKLNFFGLKIVVVLFVFSCEKKHFFSLLRGKDNNAGKEREKKKEKDK